MKRRIQAADSIRFCVRGRGAQRLLGQAAQAGLKLERNALPRRQTALPPWCPAPAGPSSASWPVRAGGR